MNYEAKKHTAALMKWMSNFHGPKIRRYSGTENQMKQNILNIHTHAKENLTLIEALQIPNVLFSFITIHIDTEKINFCFSFCNSKFHEIALTQNFWKKCFLSPICPNLYRHLALWRWIVIHSSFLFELSFVLHNWRTMNRHVFVEDPIRLATVNRCFESNIFVL